MLKEMPQTSLARAIAVRNFDEQQGDLIRTAELTGGQYQPMSPLVRGAIILTSARINERFLTERPTLPVNTHAITVSVFDDLGGDVFDQMVHDMQKDGVEPITGSQLRSVSKAIAESTLTSLVPTSMIEDGFSRMLRQADEASKIGVERNIDPATVYADDELYAELVRRSQTPVEVAKLGIQMVRQITPDRISEVIMNMISAVVQTMGVIESEPLVDPEEIQEMKQEMQETSEDPEFKEAVRTATLQYRLALRTLTREKIVRFWGQDGLDSLPKSVKPI